MPIFYQAVHMIQYQFVTFLCLQNTLKPMQLLSWLLVQVIAWDKILKEEGFQVELWSLKVYYAEKV